MNRFQALGGCPPPPRFFLAESHFCHGSSINTLNCKMIRIAKCPAFRLAVWVVRVRRVPGAGCHVPLRPSTARAAARFSVYVALPFCTTMPNRVFHTLWPQGGVALR